MPDTNTPDSKPLTPSDLRGIAQQLIRSGKMPSPEKFAEAMGETRKDYAPKAKKLRSSQATE